VKVKVKVKVKKDHLNCIKLHYSNKTLTSIQTMT